MTIVYVEIVPKRIVKYWHNIEPQSRSKKMAVLLFTKTFDCAQNNEYKIPVSSLQNNLNKSRVDQKKCIAKLTTASLKYNNFDCAQNNELQIPVFPLQINCKILETGSDEERAANLTDVQYLRTL